MLIIANNFSLNIINSTKKNYFNIMLHPPLLTAATSKVQKYCIRVKNNKKLNLYIMILYEIGTGTSRSTQDNQDTYT